MRYERKKRASMSDDELFVADVKTDIRLELGQALFEKFAERLLGRFYLNARDRVVLRLSDDPDEQKPFIQQLARELSVREMEGFGRADVAAYTDIHWFAYRRAIAERFAHCLDLFQMETDRFDKPQLSRDIEATRCFRRIVFSKYGVDAAAPLVDGIGYSEFLPIRDSYLDALRLSDEGEGLKEGLEVLGSQHADARLVLDGGADLKAYVSWAAFRCVIESYRPSLLEEFDSRSREILGSHYAVPDSFLTGADRLTPHDKKLLGFDL